MLEEQDKLLSIIDNYSIYNFPQTILIEGTKGCGKHMLVDYISKKLNLEIENITNNLTSEYLDELRVNPFSKIYLIEVDTLSILKQNVILKFIEEPISGAYNILITCDKDSLLPTVVNRCVSFKFNNYSKDFLINYIINNLGIIDKTTQELLLMCCDTPGKLNSVNVSTLKDCVNLCSLIIDKINVASFQNTLSISKRLNLVDDVNKIDIDNFLKVLSSMLLDRYKSNNNIKYFKYYLCVNNVIKKLYNNTFNKKDLFDNFLINIWKEGHYANY